MKKLVNAAKHVYKKAKKISRSKRFKSLKKTLKSTHSVVDTKKHGGMLK